MSADKCPHCGAEKSHGITGGDVVFLCGTASQHDSPSELCLERTAHAATQKALNAMRESRDEANERLAALNEWLDCHKGELAATKRELEKVKQDAEDWRNRANALEMAVRDDARARELDTQQLKSALYHLSESAKVEGDSLRARVAELEGLKCRRVGIGLEGFYAWFVIETKFEPRIGVTTIDQAMSAQKGGQS